VPAAPGSELGPSAEPDAARADATQREGNGPRRDVDDALHQADEVVGKIDSLVPTADQPENEVIVDTSRIVKWTGPLFALFSLILLPWTIYLGETLPRRQLSPHYDVAWAGFDVMLLIGLSATAYFSLRRSRYLAVSAAATATLLVVDAWFDVMTTPGSQVAESIVLAAVVELPLAAVCLWLSLHTEQLAERRITLLLAHLRPSLRRRPTDEPRQR
jgi:hypothetical protein